MPVGKRAQVLTEPKRAHVQSVFWRAVSRGIAKSARSLGSRLAKRCE